MDILHVEGILGCQSSSRGHGIAAMDSDDLLVGLQTTA